MLKELLLSAITLPTVAVAIELKPEFYQTHIEQGIYVSEVSLPDGLKKVVYAYPTGWRSSTGATELTFAHPQFLHTTLGIRLANAGTMNEEEIKARKDWLATFAPKDATDFNVDKAQPSDLVICKAPVLELGASYSAFGQKYRVQIYVIYASTGTMEFVYISPASTFEKGLETVRQSLFSLRWEKRATTATAAAPKN